MIIDLLKEQRFSDAVKLLTAKADIATYYKEYNNDRTVRITQVGKRQNKIVDGKPVTESKIPIPFQRKIVSSSAAFLFGSPVSISTNIDNNQLIIDKWDKLRLDSILLDFAISVKSETEAAIIFYPAQRNGKVVIKSRLLSHENGELLPYFDEFGDMTAFGWRFKTRIEGKEKETLHLFTDLYHYVLVNNSGWQNTAQSKPNMFGKIPVVYASQDKPEWFDVKDLIDRYEMTFSKFADTNDYFASPMFRAKGPAGQVPNKDKTGKIISLPIIETQRGNIIQSDLDVISWDRAPESLKLEFDTNKQLIYGLTDTPDLSFDNLKGLGNVSGIALQMMFFGAILKARFDEGDFRTAVERCLSVMVSGMVNITRELTVNEVSNIAYNVQFTSVLPDNIKETIETLMTATGGKPIMSQELAVEHNPIVQNKDEEINRIHNETKVDVINISY